LPFNAPEVMETLPTGASLDEISELERAMGLNLPPDLRRSLEIHNGQNDPSRCLNFCGVVSLLSTSEILSNWKMLSETNSEFDKEEWVKERAAKLDWWRASCIPFGNCEGDFSCVDTSAAGDLPAGRVVQHTHDGEIGETNIRDFTDWLERVASSLEAEKFDRKVHGYFTSYPEFAA
jgi:cell wall assembly regulator SMI1